MRLPSLFPALSLVFPRAARAAAVRSAAALWLGASALGALAHGDPAAVQPAPLTVAVRGSLPPLPEGVSELRFSELFVRPVGPRGLEPSARLLALAGRTVRLVGYMAAAAEPMAGRLVLVPMPVELGGEDEPLADDLPPSAVFVHLSGSAAARPLPNYHGLLQLVGRLAVGPQVEPDGHVSQVRLMLDEVQSFALQPASLTLGFRGDAGLMAGPAVFPHPAFR